MKKIYISFLMINIFAGETEKTVASSSIFKSLPSVSQVSSYIPSGTQVALYGTPIALSCLYLYQTGLPELQRIYEKVFAAKEKEDSLTTITRILEKENAIWNWGVKKEEVVSTEIGEDLISKLKTDRRGDLPIFYTFATYGNSGNPLKDLIIQLKPLLPVKITKRVFIPDKTILEDIIFDCILDKTDLTLSSLEEISTSVQDYESILTCILANFEKQKDKKVAELYFRANVLLKRISELKKISIKMIDDVSLSMPHQRIAARARSDSENVARRQVVPRQIARFDDAIQVARGTSTSKSPFEFSE